MKQLLDWIDEDGLSQRVVAVILVLSLLAVIVALLLMLPSRGGV